MSTSTLQAEIARKDEAFNGLVDDCMYLKKQVANLTHDVEMWRVRCAETDKEVERLKEAARHFEMLFKLVEAERNALIEVIKIQAGGKHAEEGNPNHGVDSGGLSPNTEIPPDRPGPLREAPIGNVPGE